eukprot:CAMPEP_0116109768 /NCGR_PEP_ID=MMETSP0327-20121206/17513_1 /TAXON_ID=44447 /ORGANISM="Pseudo-nitzschia delicatissima, Strain B596" /LENGTH=234 /DNA_ID=CAMNT_0003602805 /DNA_START=76 /DNA_END=780 /DNA_ORIENTATION=-
MGKTLGELRRGKNTIPRGQEGKTMKPTPFSGNSAGQRLRYGRPYPEGSNDRRRSWHGGCSGAPSSFSFRNFRCAIDAPSGGEDEKLAPRTEFLGEYREEDEPTPSLANMDEEEEDDDDIIGFVNLSDCMGSMTSLETDEMVKSFDLYMQQKHHKNCDDTTEGMIITNSRNASIDSSANNEGNVRTPEAPWSLRKWLQCRSTSASVDGIHLKNGFEPDLYTLDGIRKELFFGNSW